MIRRPQAILALLTALNLLNYIDRFVLASVLERIKGEFHVDDSQLGFLATIFLIGYFLTSPVFGALGDRGARKYLLAVGVAVWSLASISSGLARGFHHLEWSRVVVGVGEASYVTIAPTIIDDIAPLEKKGRWLAIFYVAMPVGAALGFLIGGLLESHFGWRAAFFGTGGPGLAAAVLCLFIAEPKRVHVAKRPSWRGSLGALWQSTLYRRAVIGLVAYTAATGALGLWAVTFLVRHYGMSLISANLVGGGATVIGGAGGTAIGGFWADAWIKRPGVIDNPDARLRGQLRICAIGSFIAAPLAMASFLSPNVVVGVGIFFISEFALFISTSPANAVVLQSVPPSLRASAMALSIFAMHLFGDMWSPPIVGALADRFPIEWAMGAIPLAILVSGIAWWSKLSPQPVPAVLAALE